MCIMCHQLCRHGITLMPGGICFSCILLMAQHSSSGEEPECSPETTPLFLYRLSKERWGALYVCLIFCRQHLLFVNFWLEALNYHLLLKRSINALKKLLRDQGYIEHLLAMGNWETSYFSVCMWRTKAIKLTEISHLSTRSHLQVHF